MSWWLEPLDFYCERVDASFWSEPWNALSNFAILAAGIYGVYLTRTLRSSLWLRIMSWNIVAVGVGSFLFHTHANRWGMWADLLPIFTFMLLLLGYVLRRVMTVDVRPTLAILAVFIFLTAILSEGAFREFFAGSGMYIPSLVALGAFASLFSKSRPTLAVTMITAFGVFAVGVCLRSVDDAICPYIPLGTHFLWHFIVGGLTAYLLRAFCIYEADASIEHAS